MTPTPLLKEIRYDRASRDYAMLLDGALVGFARTHHEAEVTLNELVDEILTRDAVAQADEAAEHAALAEEADADTLATRATIIIDTPGLHYAQITITASSTAALAEHRTGSQDYYALLVDGRYYDLVLAKHIDGRPELVTAFNTALDRVEQAIADLQPLPFEPTPADLVQTVAQETTRDGTSFLVTTLAAHGLALTPISYPANGVRGWYVDLAA